jgi:hypothetical protein
LRDDRATKGKALAGQLRPARRRKIYLERERQDNDERKFHCHHRSCRFGRKMPSDRRNKHQRSESAYFDAMNDLTPAAKARLIGFKATLKTRGREVKADTGETMIAVIADDVLLPDMMRTAQAEKVIYSTVSILSGGVANPRVVTEFTETAKGGRKYAVIRYDESAADVVSWKWYCEAMRETFTQADAEPSL